MRLLELSVENFGQYSGEHTFDLSMPAATTGRNLALFRGHNGAGKSTLFSAIALALHGRQAVEERIVSQPYSDFLSSRLHRYSDSYTGRTVTAGHGRVGVRMEFIQSGRPLRLKVERHWQRNGGVVEERLTLTRAEGALDIEPGEYQTWLNELFPPGLAPICFFDAERLDALASPEQQSQQVVSTLRQLLGLELVERLNEDLRTYAFKMGGMESLRALQASVGRLQSELDELREELRLAEQEAERLANEEDRIRAELADEERKLAAEGGTYAARKPVWQARRDIVRKEQEELEGQLRELCSNLLPFALAPGLCLRLNQRLIREQDLQKRQMAAELWENRVASFEQELRNAALWENTAVLDEDRQRITARLYQILQQLDKPDGEASRLVHGLTPPAQQQMQEWIAEAVYGVPRQAQLLGERLRELQEEQRQLDANLQRVPDEERLRPYQQAVAYQEQRLMEAKNARAGQAIAVGGLRYQQVVKTREFDQAARQWEGAALVERQMALATRSRQALRKYQEKLIEHRLIALQERLVTNFNRLCHKERLLPATQVDPSNFRIELRDMEGKPFSVGDFSAGERQLYALALLQALRQVSGQELPLLIDTPLARLDVKHRTVLAQEYFPVASPQVLLFATDVELDAQVLQEMEPHIAHLYSLRFNEASQQTEMSSSSYPSSPTWDKGVSARSA